MDLVRVHTCEFLLKLVQEVMIVNVARIPVVDLKRGSPESPEHLISLLLEGKRIAVDSDYNRGLS